jgi:acyl-coenzyme A synthetase/AMP-(fatty) acid ligase
MINRAALQAKADSYPVACHGVRNVISRRGGQVLSGAEFWRDVGVLAARLPDRKYIVNLCADRYRFMVGFAAALCRRQISLMPSASVPVVLCALAADYPDIYALTDTTAPPLPSFGYPDDLGDGTATPVPAAVPADQLAVIQFTSGSTGQPKPVPKSWSTLIHSARAAGTRLQVAALRGATIVGTVPHQHSYGLESVILLALQHGFGVEVNVPLYPVDVAAALARAPRPRILVTTPVHLRALVAEPDAMPPADLILSATAPLPDKLARAAETCFSAPLIEIYGCTEAGQVATRRTAQETEWHCFEGVTLHQDDTGSWANGPAVEGTAPLQDLIELTGPGRFRLGVRAADLVNIAGKRTSLSYLNHQLLSIPGVEDGVFLIDEAQDGAVARLMAVAVAPTLTPEAILRALRGRIDAVFLPRPLLLAETLPRNALGKLPRAELLRLLGRAT